MIYFIRTSYVSESYPIMLCVWDYEPTDVSARPVALFALETHPEVRPDPWLNTPVDTPSMLHAARILSTFNTVWISCVFCGRRGPCSVCLKRMQARSLTTQTSCSSLCRECLEHRYTHVFTLTSTVEATYNRNWLNLNKYSVYWSRFISAWYFKEKKFANWNGFSFLMMSSRPQGRGENNNQ